MNNCLQSCKSSHVNITYFFTLFTTFCLLQATMDLWISTQNFTGLLLTQVFTLCQRGDRLMSVWERSGTDFQAAFSCQISKLFNVKGTMWWDSQGGALLIRSFYGSNLQDLVSLLSLAYPKQRIPKFVVSRLRWPQATENWQCDCSSSRAVYPQE